MIWVCRGSVLCRITRCDDSFNRAGSGVIEYICCMPCIRAGAATPVSSAGLGPPGSGM
jgi:hypothetical protein